MIIRLKMQNEEAVSLCACLDLHELCDRSGSLRAKFLLVLLYPCISAFTVARRPAFPAGLLLDRHCACATDGRHALDRINSPRLCLQPRPPPSKLDPLTDLV